MAVLRQGSRGDAVREMQKLLIVQGFKIEADGKFGINTRYAIEGFQEENGIKIDGIVGPETMQILLGGKIDPIPDRDKTPKKAEPKSAPPIWPRQSGVSAFYGSVGKNQVLLALPFPMRIAWDKSKIIRSFSINKKAHDSAKRCFEQIAQTYGATAREQMGMDLFGGCLNVRTMRGGSGYSMHSWGIAIDFDPERNQLKWNKSKARLAKSDCEKFWRIWEAEGWVSLGRTRDYDWMHVQAARL